MNRVPGGVLGIVDVTPSSESPLTGGAAMDHRGLPIAPQATSGPLAAGGIHSRTPGDSSCSGCAGVLAQVVGNSPAQVFLLPQRPGTVAVDERRDARIIPGVTRHRDPFPKLRANVRVPIGVLIVVVRLGFRDRVRPKPEIRPFPLTAEFLKACGKRSTGLENRWRYRREERRGR